MIVYRLCLLFSDSIRGPTSLEIYTGNLNSDGFQVLLGRMLPPFIDQHFPSTNTHRLMMDNAPCHSSVSTKDYMNRNIMYHFKTPAQSPDLNPIGIY